MTPAGSSHAQPDARDLLAMTRLLDRHAPEDGFFNLAEGRINVVRSSRTARERSCVLAQPCMCIVPQGAKSVVVSQGRMEYVEDESTMVVYASEIPLSLSITRASPLAPYYCLMIPLDSSRISELATRIFPEGVPRVERVRALYVGDADPAILKSAARLLELIDRREYPELLVPLVIDEILIRLLGGPEGAAIAQIGIPDSHASKINRAIAWLRQNYTQPIRMEELAGISGMSISSFHNHFRAITSMSPLQFQKTLRLQAARRLIRTRSMDVSLAAFEVGYASASQFSREYTREFGVPPSRDAAPA